MKHVFQLGVYGNFWVGLCAVAQAALTYRLIGAECSFYLLGVLFLATFFVYNIGVLLDYKLLVSNTNKFVSIRTQVINENATYLIWLIGAAAVLILPITYAALKPLSILVFMFAGLISIAYFLPVLPSKKGLRQIPGLKTLSIGLIWTMSTVWIPIIESSIAINNTDLIRLLTERFLLVIVLALVADVRDEAVDRENRLATIVTYIGVKKVKYLCIVLLFVLLFVQCLWSCVNSNAIHSYLFIANVAFSIVAIIVVMHSFNNRSSLYHLFVVDGLTVAQFLMVEITLVFLV